MKIVHYHILKTGGTSLNAWLDGLVHAEQVRPSDWGLKFTESFREKNGSAIRNFNYEAKDNDIKVNNKNLKTNVRSQEYSRRVRAWWDVIHDHEPGIMALDGLDAFKFVVLRDPIARIMSQLADFRRYSKNTINANGPNQKQMLIDNQKMDINEFIEKYKDEAVFRNYAENQQVKAISGAAVHYFDELSGDNNLALAKKMISEGFDLVGVTERMDEFVETLCFYLKVYPNKLKKLNKTSDSVDTLKSLSKESLAALQAMNEEDYELYNFSVKVFESKKLKHDYDISYFERSFVQDAVDKLKPKILNGNDAYFDMNMPFIGFGLHARELACTDKCLRWTSGEVLEFYFPVPKNELLKLKVYIQGYIIDPFNKGFSMFVDGVRQIPEFVPEEGYREVIQCRVKTKNTYVKIQFKNLQSIKKDGDSKARGMAIRGYGYSFFEPSEISFFNNITLFEE